MQINKSKKQARQQSSSTLFDNDFSAGFEDSKFDKFKPALKALVVVILLVGIVWGGVAYFGVTDMEDNADKDYTPNTVQQVDDDTTTKDAKANDIKQDDSTQSSSPSSSSNANQQPLSSSSSATTAKPYDPSKCEPLNSEAIRLQQFADQMKITYDNAFAARKNYGYFYDKYGNSTDAQQVYDNQEAQLDLLQADWQTTLSKRNTASIRSAERVFKTPSLFIHTSGKIVV